MRRKMRWLRLTLLCFTQKLLSWDSLERYGFRELCKEIRPPIDGIQPAPSGSRYGLLMLSCPKPYLDSSTSERSHMTHSILLKKTNFSRYLKFVKICIYGML